MIAKQQYGEYLICTIGNYTSSHLAEHLDDVSHDGVTDYLRSEHLTARGLWELAARLIQDDPEAFMLVDNVLGRSPALDCRKLILQAQLQHEIVGGRKG